MKIKELIKGLNLESEKGFRVVYSADRSLLIRYYNEDCIVAYDLNKLGSIFIFKGKKRNFAFYKLVDELSSYLFNKTICRRIDLDIAIRLLVNCKVINKKEFSKIKKEIILEKLK